MRRTVDDFSTSEEDLKKLYMHITNQEHVMKSPNFNENKSYSETILVSSTISNYVVI